MNSRTIAPMAAVAFAAALTVGCETQPSAPNPSSPSIPAPENAIRLDFAETLPDRGPRMFAHTEHQYPCANYGIPTSIQSVGGGVEIEFSSISVPEICLTMPWYASVEFGLGTLDPGQQPLRIRGIAGTADLVIDVQSGSYEILGRPGPGIRFEQTR